MNIKNIRELEDLLKMRLFAADSFIDCDALPHRDTVPLPGQGGTIAREEVPGGLILRFSGCVAVCQITVLPNDGRRGE